MISAIIKINYIFLCAAIDLLEKMLDLDADTRIDATAALAHPYLKQYADTSDEPTAEVFDQTFEDQNLSIPEWKREYNLIIW